MNLIKKLQSDFTSTTLPFRPATDFISEQVRRFLNEIVLEEESDQIEDSFISHFSYWHTSAIIRWISKSGQKYFFIVYLKVQAK